MDIHRAIIFLNVILCKGASFAQSFVSLDCENVATGILNEDTKLTCSIQSTIVKTYDYIELSKIEKNEKRTSVFSLKAGAKQPHNRIIIIHPDSKNVSLLIQKTQLQDEGNYQYYLETVSGHDYQVITLKVKAPYSLPKVRLASNVTRRMKATDLICETTGYPLSEIHWFVYEKTNLTSRAETNHVKTSQGLFKLTSTLPITVAESALEGNYTCAVWNVEERVYEVKKHFPIPFLDEPNTHRQSEEKKTQVLTAIFVIVGALAIGIIILTIFRFRRNLYTVIQRESTMPMMQSVQGADS
ncbi:programmed cell death 1 ligand 1-like [Mustelus asterias]